MRHVPVDRLAAGDRVTHFEAGATVRLRAAEEIQVRQHRIGRVEQADVGTVDPARGLQRIAGGVAGHLGVERKQALETMARAQRLELLAARGGIGAEDVGAGKVERLDHRQEAQGGESGLSLPVGGPPRDRSSQPIHAVRQNNSPCGDAARGGTKRVQSNGGWRPPSKPKRFNANANRRASRSAYTPSPRRRVPKRLS